MVLILLRQADALLRGGGAGDDARPVWRARLAILVAFGAFYGLVMGSFGPTLGGRPLQAAYSAIKVPMMLTASFAICLPAFFVLNTLAGLRGDFGRVLTALTSAQAGLTVILASLAPITAFVYVSRVDHGPAILVNGVMFAAASLGAQAILRRSYRELIEEDPGHRVMLRVWLLLYILVGIQMGWVLRPFIGAPDRPTQFLREDSWSNAYIAVGRIVYDVFLGS